MIINDTNNFKKKKKNKQNNKKERKKNKNKNKVYIEISVIIILGLLFHPIIAILISLLSNPLSSLDAQKILQTYKAKYHDSSNSYDLEMQPA